MVRRSAADVFQSLPWSAELYQRLRADGQPPAAGYHLDRLAAALPKWAAAARHARAGRAEHGSRRVLVFAYLSWWLEHAASLSLLLAALGHRVHLVYLPFRRWTEDPGAFDRRRQAAYLRGVFQPLDDLVAAVDASSRSPGVLPADLDQGLAHQSLLDVQYTLQREDVDPESDPIAASLLALRQRRNRLAASDVLRRIDAGQVDTLIVPNGSILEFGAVYRAARSRGIPVTTYEFGEQRQRLWLGQNVQVMRQETDDLWHARGSTPLTASERAALEAMYTARRAGNAWAHFARQWQAGISQGAAAARDRLGLDPGKPIVLICTNVVGDSLALDRQVFTRGMADWLADTVRRLAGHENLQTIVRVHPGEILGAGHPSQDIVRAALPQVPPGLHLVAPDSSINTYDLIELAHVGVVYTSTVGLEMAMAGVPVIVTGATHYRGRGFTHDPASAREYSEMLDRRVAEPLGRRLPDQQIELAQRYAYRFFFEYPFPYPWHLIGFWDDIERRPPPDVLSAAGLEPYRPTLEALLGEPIDWARRAS